jgi:hypothetical protein
MPISKPDTTSIIIPTSIMKGSQNASTVRVVPQRVTFDLTPR